MKLKVVAVGKLKERFWKDAVAEYAKRLGAYANLQIVEVPDRDPAKAGGDAAVVKAEGADILKAVGSSYVILLAIDGTERSSESFSRRLDQLMTHGAGSIAFVIGGSPTRRCRLARSRCRTTSRASSCSSRRTARSR